MKEGLKELENAEGLTLEAEALKMEINRREKTREEASPTEREIRRRIFLCFRKLHGLAVGNQPPLLCPGTRDYTHANYRRALRRERY